MKSLVIAVSIVILGAPAFASLNLAKNEHGESMRCSYAGLSFDAIRDTDMLVAQVNDSYRKVSISVYLNAYPGSEDSINVTLKDGASLVSAPVKITSINNTCSASTSLSLALGETRNTLECTIYRSRLALKESWTNCEKP